MRAWDAKQPQVADFSKSQMVTKPKPLRAKNKPPQKNNLVTQSVPALTSINNLDRMDVSPEDLDREHGSTFFPSAFLPEHSRGKNALKFKPNFKQRFDVPDMMAVALRRAEAKAQQAMENREQELQDAFSLEHEITTNKYMDDMRNLKTAALEENTRLLADHENEIDQLIKQAEKQRMQELKILEEKVRMQCKIDKEDALEQCKQAEMVTAQKQLQAQKAEMDFSHKSEVQKLAAEARVAQQTAVASVKKTTMENMSAIFAKQLADALADRDQMYAREQAEMKRAMEQAAMVNLEQKVMAAIQTTTEDVTRAAAESMQDSVRESVLATTHELTVTHCNEVTALKTDYDGQLRQKTAEIVELETKNTHLEHDLLELHKAKTALEEQYRRKVSEEQKKSEKLKRQFDDSKAEVKSMQEASQALQKQLAQSQAKLATIEAKATSLDRELREQVNKRKGLETKVSNMQAQNLKLAQENEEKEQKMVKSSANQTALESKIEALKAELAAARQETMKALELEKEHEAAIERASLGSGSANSSDIGEEDMEERRLAAGEEMLKVGG
jgi:hypothetical protein